MEWIDTASVMVSTKPDELPVIKMRKLQRISVQQRERTNAGLLFNPTGTLFLCPNPLKFTYELYRKLLLTQITTSLHND
jgi:hypothetical protein